MVVFVLDYDHFEEPFSARTGRILPTCIPSWLFLVAIVRVLLVCGCTEHPNTPLLDSPPELKSVGVEELASPRAVAESHEQDNHSSPIKVAISSYKSGNEERAMKADLAGKIVKKVKKTKRKAKKKLHHLMHKAAHKVGANLHHVAHG